MRYYRKRYPNSSYGLADAATRFGVTMDYRTAHSALIDAEVLFKVFKSLSLPLLGNQKIDRHVSKDKECEKGNEATEAT